MRIPSFRPTLLAGVVALTLSMAHSASQAQTLNTMLMASGLSSPVYATSPLADGRLFVVEQGGAIKVVQNGITSNFLSVPVATGGEQGLLGLAFDPNYGVSGSAGYGRFFVDYIDPSTKDTVVASYRLNASTGLADASSRTEIIRVDQPDFTNHKAGWLGFKPGDANDLYIALGDGGSGNDPLNNAQNKNVLLGKMLRIDINRDDFADPNINYGIPSSNPFANTAGARGEIFAYGLRNPWRNSFDRATGDLWIGDVGQSAREEIDFIKASAAGGQNFGWRIREGEIATPGINDPAVTGLTGPALTYDHSFGIAITGGYVVRQAGSPLYGKYVFADYGSGRIWAIDAGLLSNGTLHSLSEATELTAILDAGAAGAIGNISSFGEGANGELYIVDLAGRVVQVTAVPEPATYALMLLGGGLLALRARRRS